MKKDNIIITIEDTKRGSKLSYLRKIFLKLFLKMYNVNIIIKGFRRLNIS